MNLFVLVTGTAGIIVFTWFFSVKHGRYHGIPRFFAFESIFLLLILNVSTWFCDPFSWHQVISWLSLIASVYPGISGYLMLKRKGKPEKSFENTTLLVKRGVYRYIRHPLYISLLLFGTGVMFKDPQPFQVMLGIILVIAIIFTALMEEKEMIAKFGDQYREYMHETKRFIPFVI